MSYKKSPRKQSYRLSTPVRLGVAAVAACFLAAPLLAAPPVPSTNLPTGFTNLVGIDPRNIIAGANTLNITTSAIRSAADVGKFSVAAGYSLNITQPTVSASVLFRVLTDPTYIYGTMRSNGGVWLVNPAGILVGPGGKVDVAAFVASTLNISNADFLAGRNVFINDGNAKNVINQGEIRTPAGGSVYLIGSNVSNEGIITTPKGETILAAGATVSLIDSATPGVKVDITGSEGNATNLGTLTAEAGRIGIAGVIVRNSGTVNASSVVSEGGRVFLKASQDAYVDGNGRIVTTGTKGGSVEVLGNRVAVMGKAEIDASGIGDTNAGGGKILVGGDYQGKNPDVQNANVTYFGPGATLKADAGKVGDGGTVIVWADDTTRAYGNISARGGATGGNGGFVETSGKRYLAVDGIHVDTRAPQGKTGNWLLDPSEIFITGPGPTTADPTTVDSIPSGILTTQYTTYGGSSSTISDTTINAMLDFTDVIIHTAGGTGGNGNINVTNANISKPVGGMALTLAADGIGGGGDIIITNSSINVRDGVTLLAGWDSSIPIPYGPDGNELSSAHVINGTGDIKIFGSTIQSSEWAVNLWAGRDIILSNNLAKGTWIQGAVMDVRAGGDLTLTGGGASDFINQFGGGVMLRSMGQQNIVVDGDILLTAGSVDNLGFSGSSMNGGSVVIEAMGNQTISAANISLVAGTSGRDNAAAIMGHGSIQDITVNSSLELTGGAVGEANYAWIGASGVQTINAHGADIILNGGASGGAWDRENSADIGLSETNTGGSQTVYAGSITINGNGDSTTYGGAGFGSENGRSKSFYITADLIMTGGGSEAGDFRSTPAYIGSETGGTIFIEVGGSITLTGGTGSNGGVLIGSLNNSASAVTIVAGNSVTIDSGYGGVGIGSIGPAITAGNMAGAVYIANGSSITASNEISIEARNSVDMNGFLFADCTECGGVSITAGNGVNGGNIRMGSSSSITGEEVNLVAHGNGANNGDIVQNAAGEITIDGDSGYSSYFKADGNLHLDGLISLTDGGNLDGFAGFSGASGKSLRVSDISSPFGGDLSFESTGDAVVGSINAPTGEVVILAGGAIYDNNGPALNITADSIGLESMYGGVAGGLAISMDTSAATDLFADVTSSAINGGISIRNFSSPLGEVRMDDSANLQPSINFFNSSDLTLGYGSEFSTSNGGSILIASGGNLTYDGADIYTDGSLILGAAGVLEIRRSLNTNGSLGIAAPVVYVHGDGGEGGGGIYASGDIFLGATQQMTIGNFDYTGVYSDTNITVNAGTLLMQTGGLLAAYGGVDITAGSFIGVTDSFISAGTDITAKVAGDIRWNDDSHMFGSNDVFLTLSGGSSTVYLNDTAGLPSSTIEAGLPTTVHLNFLGRSSGGVVIDGVDTTTTVDGGSGFYANGLPATTASGGGLVITYANSTAIVLDPCASSPDLCKPPTPEDPFDEAFKADACASAPDSAQCKAQKADEENEGEQFGDEGGKKDEKQSQKKVAQCGV